ncbi:MAG: acetyl-CoA carboxylase biotin carboxyl carrier protein [Rhizobiales bacterium]|nr:acetyl-CoA carboxylase biotin carboxyl carrier protein [Hyphomicrobiales bacterium]NRB12960.1 acetyl-CoA carboxylase biotin carboxyl carrier protein [Hyphomicrobiales bacterium]
MMDKNQKLDADFVEKLTAILNDGELNEIEVRSDDFKIRIVKNPPTPASVTYSGAAVGAPVMAAAPVVAAPAAAISEPAVAKEDDLADHSGAVKSPMVGTCYLASDPNSPNFIQVGDNVQKGQTLLIVEAMKTMNNISAPQAGKVIAILVTNESPIEFGQSLVVIE